VTVKPAARGGHRGAGVRSADGTGARRRVIARSCLMLSEACGGLSSALGCSTEQRHDKRWWAAPDADVEAAAQHARTDIGAELTEVEAGPVHGRRRWSMRRRPCGGGKTCRWRMAVAARTPGRWVTSRAGELCLTGVVLEEVVGAVDSTGGKLPMVGSSSWQKWRKRQQRKCFRVLLGMA
jgi:hypothetical protein